MTVLSEPSRAAAEELSAIDRIRNAALNILATHGASGTSLRAVAAAAGRDRRQGDRDDCRATRDRGLHRPRLDRRQTGRRNDLRLPFELRHGRWHRRGERGETRADLDLTWAAINSLVLALGALILRGHIERHLPEPFTSPAQPERWQGSVNSLLREGLFKQQ